MNLSERLRRAEIERQLAAGAVTSEAALKPPPQEDEPAWVADDPIARSIQIEVPAIDLVSVAEPPRETPRGSLFNDRRHGGPCPNCNRPGRIDLIDLVGNNMHLTCEACGAMWQTPAQQSPATAEPSA